MIKKKFNFGLVLLLVVLFVGLVSAGSYSESNPNYGLFKKYDSGSSASSLTWNDGVCNAGQDFVLQIAPFGCTPSVVRSDLLEEQNVPVFCAIAATQINPLIDVDAIDSISFSGQYPKEISGIGFHPARAALGTTQQTNYPILDNIGYAVIVLKKQEVEAEMPDFVEGNLTAKIRYDVKDAFGVGNSLFYLPESNDGEFEEIKKSYSFFEGKFYLRAERIEENYATVSIYNDMGKISSINLEKGKSSNKISLPGFNCLAKLQLRLDGLENPGTIVKLKINGEEVNVVEGQKFLDNNCQIVDVDSNGLVKSVRLSCYEDNGRKSFELKIAPRLKIKVGDSISSYGIGDEINGMEIKSIEIEKEDSNDIREVKVVLEKDGGQKNIYHNSQGDIRLIDFAEPQNAKLSTEIEGYYEKAFEDYDALSNSFGDNEYQNGVSYKEYVLKEKITLAKSLGQKKTLNDLCVEYSEEFGDNSECQDVVKLSSSGSASEQVFINGDSISISLEDVVDSDFKDYGAKVVVDGVNRDLEKDKIVAIGNNEYIQLVELREDYAKVKVHLKSGTNYVDSIKTLKPDVVESFDTSHKIYLDEINLKKLAKVSLVPSIDNVGTSSNFGFKIGIEKRAIQLAPDEIQDKIDALNETIEKLEATEKSLGDVVQTMKGACLATSTFLIAKNFLFNQGESLARSEVTSIWNDKCAAHMGGTKQIEGKEGKTYATSDACLADNSEAIDDAVSFRAETKQDVSEMFGNLQEGITEKKWAGLESVVDDEKLWENVKNSEMLNNLEKDLEACYGGGDTIMISSQTTLSASDIKGRISKETMTITQLRDLVANAKDCRNNPEIAKAELEGILGKLYTASETPKQIEEYGEKTGHSDHSTVLSSEKIKTISVNDFLTYEDIKNDYSSKTINEKDNVYFIKNADDNKEYLIVYGSDGVVKQTYSIIGNSLTKTSSTNPLKVKFELIDDGTYHHKFISSQGNTKPVVSYYETSPYKGLPAVVPFDLKNGWYVSVSQDVGLGAGSASYDDSGAANNYYICNVGINGREEGGAPDDKCRMINKGTGQPYSAFNGLGEKEAGELVKCAEDAVRQASRQHGSKTIEIRTSCGDTIKLETGTPAAAVPDMQCQNFMSPSDCELMFNVCDPVICPSSRCDFGGSYPVADVIQSGIVGGIFLCLPNFVGFGGDVYIPFCLSGIHAGIEGLLSVYTSYRDCLQENLDSGKTVGICDEIYSVYLCEFLWKQALPLAKYSVPKIIEALIGQNTRGGGEYFAFSNAISVADKSIDYFTDYYAANSFEAFKTRSAEEVGTEVCKNYASGVGPNIDSMLSSFTDPDSPSQFHGWFEEEEYTTATVPPTSQYKAFYHIYAGKDAQAYYQVYLKGGAESSYYQDTTSTRLVASGYVGAGDYASETKDFTAPAGYGEMCIRVNDQEECGFKGVSTSAALNYVKDKYVSSEATETDISTEDECVSGTILSTLTESEIYEYGVIRICAHDDPGVGTDAKAGVNGSRWTQTGWCDEEKEIKCWLDTESVKDAIKTKSVEGETLDEVNSNTLNNLRNLESFSSAESAIDKLTDGSNPEEIIQIVTNNYGKLIMNDDVIKALRLRAGAYGKLANSGKSAGEKVEASKINLDLSKFNEKERTLIRGATACEDCSAWGDGIICTKELCEVIDKKFGKKTCIFRDAFEFLDGGTCIPGNSD